MGVQVPPSTPHNTWSAPCYHLLAASVVTEWSQALALTIRRTAIEAFTAVLPQLNVRYRTRVTPKLTGIKGDPRRNKASSSKEAPPQPTRRQRTAHDNPYSATPPPQAVVPLSPNGRC